MRAFWTSTAVAIMVSMLILAGRKSHDDSEAGPHSARIETLPGDRRIGIALRLARGIDSGYGRASSGGGYHYEMRVEVDNPNSAPLSFDAVDMEFTDVMNRHFSGSMFLTGQTIRFTRRSIVTSYRYGDTHPWAGLPKSADDGEPIVTVVDGHQVVSFPSSIAAALPPAQPGSQTVINVTLLLSGRPVSGVYRAILPSVMEIPDQYQARDEEDWFRVTLRPASELLSFLGGGAVDLAGGC